MVYICNFHCGQAWERWIKKSQLKPEHKEDLKLMLKTLANCNAVEGKIKYTLLFGQSGVHQDYSTILV